MKGLYAHLSSWHIDPCHFPWNAGEYMFAWHLILLPSLGVKLSTLLFYFYIYIRYWLKFIHIIECTIWNSFYTNNCQVNCAIVLEVKGLADSIKFISTSIRSEEHLWLVFTSYSISICICEIRVPNLFCSGFIINDFYNLCASPCARCRRSFFTMFIPCCREFTFVPFSV